MVTPGARSTPDAVIAPDVTPTTAACPVCGAHVGEELERRGHYTLLHCGGCDVVHAAPMHAADPAWYEATYLVRDLAVDTRMRDYYRWALRRLSEAAADRPLRLLDVGCGQGTFVAAARRASLDAHGIDVSDAAIEAGRRRHGPNVLRRGRPDDLLREGQAGRYDGVTLFEVVEHLEDPLGYLATTMALLRPHGLIVLSVPNRDRWPTREFNDYPPHHMTRWSPRAVTELLHRAGCDVLAVDKGSRLASVHIFFGNMMRDALYRALRLRPAFNEGVPPDRLCVPDVLPLARRMIRRHGAAARRLRDAVMWVPALLSYPFLAAFFEGYNLMVIARKRE